MSTLGSKKRKMDSSSDSDSQEYESKNISPDDLHDVMDSFELPDGTPRKKEHRRSTQSQSPDAATDSNHSRRSSKRLWQRGINTYFNSSKPNTEVNPKDRKTSEEVLNDSSPPQIFAEPKARAQGQARSDADVFRRPLPPSQSEAENMRQRSANRNNSDSRDTSLDSDISRQQGLIFDKTSFSTESDATRRTSLTTEVSASSQEAGRSFGATIEPQAIKSATHWKVKRLAEGGLFAPEYVEKLNRCAYHVRYECTRMMNSLKLSPDVLTGADMKALKDHGELIKLLTKYADRPVSQVKCSSAAWDMAADCSANVSYTASLTFKHPKEGEIFGLSLNPLRHEGRSCRFFRKFGAHRFLKVSLPSWKRDALPSYLKGQNERIHEEIVNWANKPDKLFLGCSWTAFCIKPRKDKRNPVKGPAKEVKDFDIFLFATEGIGLKGISISDMVTWFLPVRHNEDLAFSKAFARLELGLSTTIATFQFKPSQIVKIHDILADGTPEDDQFNDTVLDWSVQTERSKPAVMNDGCSGMSYAAATTIWELLGQGGPCPSIFQGRIGPWKGTWTKSPRETGNEDDIWIEVTGSQQKFERHVEDLDSELYDKERLTFEVLQWSKEPVSSYLGAEHLPILEDRRTSRRCIDDLVCRMLEDKEQSIIKAFKSPNSLYKWIEDEFAPYEDEDSDIEAHSIRLCQTIKTLLRSDFQFQYCLYLQSLAKSLARTAFERISAEVKIPVSRSTTLLGIADPLGVLEPGEMHVMFSRPVGDEGHILLDDMEAIVSRHPALRGSDIQKVKAVFHPKLAHLVNVVVFSSRGIVPLASKLQGGDYDGDRFWICWDPAIVKNFENAPVPPPAEPEDLGIKVNRKKLGELVDRNVSEPLRRFLNEGLRFNLQPNLLGVVTNMYSKICYAKNSISSPAANRLADLHDLLVDSAKQGYSYDEDTWTAFKRSLEGVGPMDKNPPPYKDINRKKLFGVEGEKIRFNPNHIVAHVVFQTSRDKIRQITNGIKNLKTEATTRDNDIETFYTQTMANASPAIHEYVDQAQREMRAIFTKWWIARNDASHSEEQGKKVKSYEYERKAVDAYRKIHPTAEAEKAMNQACWFRETPPGRPSHWDLFKASLLFYAFRNERDTRGSEFAFRCDCINICDIKAWARKDQRPVVVARELFCQMKMRQIKDDVDVDRSFTGTSFSTEIEDDGLVAKEDSFVILDDGNDTEVDDDDEDEFYEC